MVYSNSMSIGCIGESARPFLCVVLARDAMYSADCLSGCVSHIVQQLTGIVEPLSWWLVG